MSFGICPVPACTRPLSAAEAILCPHHYFCVDARNIKECVRFKMRVARLPDGFKRTEFTKQIAIRTKLLVAEARLNTVGVM